MPTLHLHHTLDDDTPRFTDDSRVPDVAAMFGLGLDDHERSRTVVAPVELTLRRAQVVFVTGPSGGGKSTLLRLIDRALRSRDDASVLRFDTLPQPPDRPLADALAGPLDRVLAALGAAGLGDAFVMLRRPRELSDGQRYRLRLAQAMLATEAPAPGPAPGSDPDPDPAPGSGSGSDRAPGPGPLLHAVLADEFGATLDRPTAAVVARNVRKWVRRSGVCFVAATTHDDLLEPLDPDVLIYKPLGEAVQVLERGGAAAPNGEDRR